MKKLYFLVAMVFSFACARAPAPAPTPVPVQDAACDNPYIRFLGLSGVLNDCNLVMPPDSMLKLPSTWFYFLLGRCTNSEFLKRDSTGVPRLWQDTCNIESEEGGNKRFRWIDKRNPDPPWIVLFTAVKVHSHEPDGSSQEYCRVVFDKGFWNGGEPTGKFDLLDETVCGENHNRLQELLDRLMPTTDQPEP